MPGIITLATSTADPPTMICHYNTFGPSKTGNAGRSSCFKNDLDRDTNHGVVGGIGKRGIQPATTVRVQQAPLRSFIIFTSTSGSWADDYEAEALQIGGREHPSCLSQPSTLPVVRDGIRSYEALHR